MTNEDFDASRGAGIAHPVRRAGMAAAAAAVVLVAMAGCSPETPTVPGTDPTPSSAGSPSPASASPTSPARELTEAQLLTVDDIPVVDQETYTETPEGVGRDPQALTVCRPEGTGSEIDADDALSRNFRLATLADGEPAPAEPPIGDDPTIYTQVLQFGSEDAARAAYQTYRDWLESCKDTIAERGDTAAGGAPEWYDVKTDVAGAEAGFTEVIWIPADDESGSGYFESVGLALLGDRLAVTVSLVYGQDYIVGYDQDGDPDTGLPPHPQYALLVAAAGRLG